jgi:nucleoside-diphosphate-sugar epimerase
VANQRSDERGNVVVAGATSLIGRFLLPRLSEAGFGVHALSRRPPPPGTATGSSATWHLADIGASLAELPVEPDRLIHLAPLWLAPGVVRQLARRGLRRALAFGSTSRFTKAGSSHPREREIARRLEAAEDDFMRACEMAGVAWTLFRPTLIYGHDLDQNVAVIARFAGRFGFFPVAGRGDGRRQPVHAEDLAVACVAALERPATLGKAYELSGGTTLSYREMVEEIFRGLGRRPRVVGIPRPLLRGAIQVLSRLVPAYSHLTPQMADRIGQDLCFDHAAATEDFGYSPRPFAYRPSPR